MLWTDLSSSSLRSRQNIPSCQKAWSGVLRVPVSTDTWLMLAQINSADELGDDFGAGSPVHPNSVGH